jgi:hypothetical protein
MGLMLSNALTGPSTVTTTGTVEVPLAAETLQEVLKDLDRAPEIVGNIVSVERIRGGKFEEGTHWREVRYFQKRKLVFYKTITSISKDPHFMVSVNVDLREASWNHKHACETFSFSIIPVNEKSCILLWTTAFVAAGIVGKLSLTLFRSCMVSSLQRYLAGEFDDYTAAGLALQKSRLQK